MKSLLCSSLCFNVVTICALTVRVTGVDAIYVPACLALFGTLVFFIHFIVELT